MCVIVLECVGDFVRGVFELFLFFIRGCVLKVWCWFDGFEVLVL